MNAHAKTDTVLDRTPGRARPRLSGPVFLAIAALMVAVLAFPVHGQGRSGGPESGTSGVAGWVPVGTSLRDDILCTAYATTSVAFAGTASSGLYWSVDGGDTWLATGLTEEALNGAAVLSVSPSPTFGVDGIALASTDEGAIYRSTNGIMAPWEKVLDLPGTPVTRVRHNSGGTNVWAGTYGDGLYHSPDGIVFAPIVHTMPGSGKITDMDLEYNEVWCCTDWTDAGTPNAGVYNYNGDMWTQVDTTIVPPPATPYRFRSIVVPPMGQVIRVGDRFTGMYEYFRPLPTWSLFCNRPTWVEALGVAPNYDPGYPPDTVVYMGGGSGLFLEKDYTCTRTLPSGLLVHDMAFRPGTWPSGTVGDMLIGTSAGLRLKKGKAFPIEPDAGGMANFDASTLSVSPSFTNASTSDKSIYATSRRFGVFLNRRDPLDIPFFRRLAPPSSTIGPNGETLASPISAVSLSPIFDGLNLGCGTAETTLFLATDGDGIFQSDDGGATLQPYMQSLSNDSISSLALSPAYINASSRILFAGTSNLPNVYRSGPSGTWSPTDSFPTTTVAPSKVTCIGLPPNYNGNTQKTLFSGTDKGLFRSTTDGTSWQLLQGQAGNTLPIGSPVTAMAFHEFPLPFGTMFATVKNVGVYKSIDGGDNWYSMGPPGFFTGIPLSSIALSPNFAADQTLGVGCEAFGTNTGVWKSIGGASFEPLPNGTNNQVRSLSYAAVATPPWLFMGEAKGQVFYHDGTTGWLKAPGFGTASREIYDTVTGPSPDQADLFTAGTDGVNWSQDGGETFVPLNRGLTATGLKCVTQVNSLFSFMAGLTPRLVAGTDGEGIWSLDGSVGSDGTIDWAAFPWVRRLILNSTIRRFSRERDAVPFLIRAGGSTGTLPGPPYAWTSVDGLLWAVTDGGLPGPLTDVRHGVLPGKTPGKGIKGLFPVPKGPSGSTVWGTVFNSGVQKGTDTGFAERAEATLSVTWESWNGQGVGALPDLGSLSVIQLADKTLLCGAETSGVYRSENEAYPFWEASGAGLEGTSMEIRDFYETASGDVLCAVNGPTTGNGGVFLSGDSGRHWVTISEGFDTTDKSLSSITCDDETPPTYYSGTYSKGPYARTIPAPTYPTVTSLDVTTGASTGGTEVVVTGTGFANACPEGYGCLDSSAVVTFGGVDAATTFSSDTSLIAYSPPHPGGVVEVGVRNPDSRTGVKANAFTYTELETAPSIELERNILGRVEVTWSDAPGGSVTLYRSPRADFSVQVVTDTATGSSGTYTYTDTTGTNGYLYFYKVE